MENNIKVYELAQDNIKVLNLIEKEFNDFLETKFNEKGKPKKFFWWALLHADEVFNLIVTVLGLIKKLKINYYDQLHAITPRYNEPNSGELELSVNSPYVSVGTDSVSDEAVRSMSAERELS